MYDCDVDVFLRRITYTRYAGMLLVASFPHDGLIFIKCMTVRCMTLHVQCVLLFLYVKAGENREMLVYKTITIGFIRIGRCLI